MAKLERERREIQEDEESEALIQTLGKEARELGDFSEALTRVYVQLQNVEEQLNRQKGKLEGENEEADREIVRLEVLLQRLDKEIVMND